MVSVQPVPLFCNTLSDANSLAHWGRKSLPGGKQASKAISFNHEEYVKNHAVKALDGHPLLSSLARREYDYVVGDDGSAIKELPSNRERD
jgi:hypothetical protein